MPSPCIGPNSFWRNIGLWINLLLINDCCRVHIADIFTVFTIMILYKIEKWGFTKGSLEKEKEISNTIVLKRKTLFRIIPYVKLLFFVTKQVYMRLQHLETHHTCTSVSLENSFKLSLLTASFAKKYDYSATCIGQYSILFKFSNCSAYSCHLKDTNPLICSTYFFLPKGIY